MEEFEAWKYQAFRYRAAAALLRYNPWYRFASSLRWFFTGKTADDVIEEIDIKARDYADRNCKRRAQKGEGESDGRL